MGGRCDGGCTAACACPPQSTIRASCPQEEEKPASAIKLARKTLRASVLGRMHRASAAVQPVQGG